MARVMRKFQIASTIDNKSKCKQNKTVMKSNLKKIHNNNAHIYRQKKTNIELKKQKHFTLPSNEFIKKNNEKMKEKKEKKLKIYKIYYMKNAPNGKK